MITGFLLNCILRLKRPSQSHYSRCQSSVVRHLSQTRHGRITIRLTPCTKPAIIAAHLSYPFLLRHLTPPHNHTSTVLPPCKALGLLCCNRPQHRGTRTSKLPFACISAVAAYPAPPTRFDPPLRSSTKSARHQVRRVLDHLEITSPGTVYDWLLQMFECFIFCSSVKLEMHTRVERKTREFANVRKSSNIFGAGWLAGAGFEQAPCHCGFRCLAGYARIIFLIFQIFFYFNVLYGFTTAVHDNLYTTLHCT